jgi:hypothetical protein
LGQVDLGWTIFDPESNISRENNPVQLNAVHSRGFPEQPSSSSLQPDALGSFANRGAAGSDRLFALAQLFLTLAPELDAALVSLLGR